MKFTIISKITSKLLNKFIKYILIYKNYNCYLTNEFTFSLMNIDLLLHYLKISINKLHRSF